MKKSYTLKLRRNGRLRSGGRGYRRSGGGGKQAGGKRRGEKKDVPWKAEATVDNRKEASQWGHDSRVGLCRTKQCTVHTE